MAYRILALIFVLCTTTSLSRAEDLLSILEQALLSDPRVRISELQVEIGDAQDDQAYSQLLPSVTVGVQFSEIDRTDVDVEPPFPGFPANRHDNFPGERYSVSARQVLYNREALKNRKRTLNVLRQYGHERDDVRASLFLDVGQKYLTVLGNEDNLALVRAEKDSVLKRLEQFEVLYEKRLIKITDLLDAQVRRDQILADEIDVENSVLIAKEELRSLTGTNVGELTPLSANATFPQLEGTLDYWVERSSFNNPALLARQKAVDAASAGLEQAKGRRWPTLDLQLSYLDSDTGFESAQVNRTQTSSVAVVFNMPILTGGANWARAREARSQLKPGKNAPRRGTARHSTPRQGSLFHS